MKYTLWSETPTGKITSLNQEQLELTPTENLPCYAWNPRSLLVIDTEKAVELGDVHMVCYSNQNIKNNDIVSDIIQEHTRYEFTGRYRVDSVKPYPNNTLEVKLLEVK